jgi:UDP-N-acetylglucosamine 1-carboxyvinyltransferase
MDKIVIRGGRKLEGVVPVSGSKNAALPILISSLLTDKACEFDRVPALQDIRTTFKVLASMGVKVSENWAGNSCVLQADQITVKEAPYDLVRTMRASVLVLGPILARFGTAKVSLPGGCAIGARPIDFHLSALEKMGAEIRLEGGYVVGSAKRLRGARIHFEFPSVGATENLMMAASLAKGETVLENCAKEPEIVDLACALRAMGAEISGEGTETIQIQGKDSLHGCKYSIMGDRIEAGTFLAAGFATLGRVKVSGIRPDFLEAVLVKFEGAGAEITRGENFIELNARARPKGIDFSTLPFPGFPTDMQAQLMAVLTLSSGTSVITETIFENRFMHVPELARLGADIRVNGNTAIVRGVERLESAPLMATDLRASASLMIGGLAAHGETTIHRVYHLDRGYEKIEEKLRALGAEIERKS